jgi:hypothetical protein
MTFIRCARGILTCGALHLAPPLGCVDTSPLTYVASDASPKPSGPDCAVCLRRPNTPGPGCANEFVACSGSASCKATIACVLAVGCLERASQVEFVSCSLPCAKEAGILAENDPNLQLGMAVFTCAAMPAPGCGGECFVSGSLDASE